MSLVLKDRVKETSTTSGTGALTLAGAVVGYQSFSVIGNGNDTYYTIYDPYNNTWEVGIGTYSSTGPTLTRNTVLSSSNSGNLVSFSNRAKTVFCVYPAEKAVYEQLNGDVSLLGALSVDGNATLGNDSGDTLTVNASTVSIPNGLNFDSNTFVIDAANNRVGFGTSAPVSVFDVYSATTLTANFRSDTASNLLFSRYTSDAVGGQFFLRKGRGTYASPTAVATNDAIGTIFFSAYGGTNNRNTASIQGRVENYTSDTNISGNILFSTANASTVTNERMRITAAGNVLVTSEGVLGYGTGSGGTVTQATSKANPVTLNKPTGQITMNSATMLAGDIVGFQLNNTFITTSDTIIVNPVSSSFSYTAVIQSITAGAAVIRVTNISTGSLSEAVQINFAIIKGATA